MPPASSVGSSRRKLGQPTVCLECYLRKVKVSLDAIAADSSTEIFTLTASESSLFSPLFSHDRTPDSAIAKDHARLVFTGALSIFARLSTPASSILRVSCHLQRHGPVIVLVSVTDHAFSTSPTLSPCVAFGHASSAKEASKAIASRS